jgi:hypothetical protein
MKRLLSLLFLAAIALSLPSTGCATNTPSQAFQYNPTTKAASDTLNFTAGQLEIGGVAVVPVSTSGSITTGYLVYWVDPTHLGATNNISAIVTPLIGPTSGVDSTVLTLGELAVEYGTYGNGTTPFSVLHIGAGGGADTGTTALSGGVLVPFIYSGGTYGSVPGGTQIYPWVGSYNGSTWVFPSAAPGPMSVDLEPGRTSGAYGATGIGATVLGVNSKATGNYSIAVGNSASGVTTASGSGAYAQGNNAVASGNNSSAIGSATTAIGGGQTGGVDSVAIGGSAGIVIPSVSAGPGSIALGGATATGASDIAVGPGAATGGASAGAWTVVSYTNASNSVFTLSSTTQANPALTFLPGDNVIIVPTVASGLPVTAGSVLAGTPTAAATITIGGSTSGSGYIGAAVYDISSGKGQFAFSSAPGTNYPNSPGAIESRWVMLQGYLNSTTATRLTVDGGSDTTLNRFRFEPGKVYNCLLQITCQDVSANVAAWTYKAAFYVNDQGIPRQIGSTQQIGTEINDSGNTSTVAISCDLPSYSSTYTVLTGSSNTATVATVNVTGTPFTANQYANFLLYDTTNSQVYSVASNTTSQLTAEIIGGATPPSVGDSFKLFAPFGPGLKVMATSDANTPCVWSCTVQFNELYFF